MSRQWIRHCKLTIEGASGALDVSDMRIRFRVLQNTLQTPNNAEIIITNLSDATANLVREEGKKVTLSAGYEDSPGEIFTGEIIQKRKGRENPVDTYLTILATNADKAYNFAVVNKSLAAGHTFKDQVNVALEAMKPYGVTAGYIGDLGNKKMPRGRTMFGMARDFLRDIGFATNTAWSIQNNKLQVLENNKTLPGDAFVLNSQTGMIGLPVQTVNGIIVRCLLNNKLRPGSRIQINQASIQQAAFNPNYTAAVQNDMLPSLADDGFYKALVVDHHGDTRGNPWYTDLVCLRADGQGAIPLGLSRQGILTDH